MTKKAASKKLKPCPRSPNCVSSMAKDDKHFIEPIPFSSSQQAAKKALLEIVSAMPRTKIITRRKDYIHAECTSFLFRFVDDLEFLIDDRQKMIHVRSASRTGYSDFGVNRKRVEGIRKRFQNNNLR